MKTIDAADLSGRHLGKTIAVAGQEVAASGQLAGVNHSADLIEERTLGGHPHIHAIGQSRVVLTLSNGSSIIVEPAATVELLD